MPLRDHFRPPVWSKASWEGFHGGWPMTMVLQLVRVLPMGYFAYPTAPLGAFFEIGVSAYQSETPAAGNTYSGACNGVATATWAPPQPTMVIDADLPDQYE